MRIIAILGGSGSGKTDLSLKLAKPLDCIILSLDSLSVYQQIDIASAKPSKEDRAKVLHFGIDRLNPVQSHNVQIFIHEYERAYDYAKSHQKNLLIVGGTSFYLKVLLEGLSIFPNLTQKEKLEVKEKIESLKTQQS
ncbi:MAG: tRNA (adenosine(37)-N6)-dimethylallyltransferase MiaA, partial [Helicobacter sp.]|nr:tRNA (adenosine(37)-N6)-dimethylallyltransferase MiaA [Helicobacter sp.]